VRSPKAYLYRIAINIAYQHRLSCDAAPRLVPLDESVEARAFLPDSLKRSDPEAAAELHERLDEITLRLSPLPARVRSALLWHYHDGYTCEEIGERLAIKRNRVKKYISRAMSRVRASGDDSADPMDETSLARSAA
jgi:RNA polymerase sigma factor (sigma-70 family)